MGAGDGAALFIDGIQVFDEFQGTSGSYTGSFAATEAVGKMMLHKVLLQYRHVSGASKVKLEWENELVAKTVVPTNNLHASASAIKDASSVLVTYMEATS